MRAHLIELQKLKEEEKLMRKLTVSVKKMSWEELEVSLQKKKQILFELY